VSTSRTLKGHLEGPEATSNPDFDLYLQKQSGSTWTDVATAQLSGSVEELQYSAAVGTYRWRVCSYSGTGSFTLYAQ
jgi:hypothetical protein